LRVIDHRAGADTPENKDAPRGRGEETGNIMNIAKALAVSAVAGMLMGSGIACGGGGAAGGGATDPAAAGGGKSSCSGGGGAAPAASGKSSCSASGGKASCSGGGAAPKY
jgi:hypothetical protein